MQVRASTEIAPGLSGLSILNNSLAGPRKYTARLLVCGSTFLKGPCRILGAGTVSCLQCLYLTYPERNDDDYNPTMEERDPCLPPPGRRLYYLACWKCITKGISRCDSVLSVKRSCVCVGVRGRSCIAARKFGKISKRLSSIRINILYLWHEIANFYAFLANFSSNWTTE